MQKQTRSGRVIKPRPCACCSAPGSVHVRPPAGARAKVRKTKSPAVALGDGGGPVQVVKRRKLAGGAVGAGAPNKSRKRKAPGTATTATFEWEYFLDVPIDGKVVDWYKYDAAAGATVEAKFRAWQRDSSKEPAFVDLDMGKWRYHVDWVTLTQTNLTHEDHRVRKIRRVQVHLDTSSAATPSPAAAPPTSSSASTPSPAAAPSSASASTPSAAAAPSSASASTVAAPPSAVAV